MWWIVLSVCLALPNGRSDLSTCQVYVVPGHYQAEGDCLAAIEDRRDSFTSAAKQWGLTQRGRVPGRVEPFCSMLPRHA